MRLTPGLGVHMRGLADELLVHDYPGATLVRAEREMLATAVSRRTTASSAWTLTPAFATALLERSGGTDRSPLLDTIKEGSSEGFDPKMQALLHIARVVRRNGST